MRSRRTDRKELKRELERLRGENAALSARLSALSRTEPETESAPPAAPQVSAPVILSGGYPARAVPRMAKSLREAKEILMSSDRW